jgi:MoxR-like ATPase
MLPEASLVFLDELLNANSAILNSLLGVLNERVFRRGRETRAVPLVMAVGASNRLPEDESLGALFDRFLMRVRCANVPEERLGEVLEAGWRLEHARTAAAAPLSIDDVRELARLLTEVDLAPVRAGHVELVKRLRAAGIHVSDRRAVKVQRLVAASALLCGRLAADLSDLWVFRHIWDTDEQEEILAAIVEETTARSSSPAAHPRARTSAPPDPERLASDVDELERRLAQAGITAQSLAELRDHLSILAARCQWVQGAEEREHLAQKVEALWSRVGNAS